MNERVRLWRVEAPLGEWVSIQADRKVALATVEQQMKGRPGKATIHSIELNPQWTIEQWISFMNHSEQVRFMTMKHGANHHYSFNSCHGMLCYAWADGAWQKPHDFEGEEYSPY